MSKSFVITVPHSLGADGAKKVAAERIGMLQRQYGDKLSAVDITWTGNHADFHVVALGQTVNAQLDLMEDSARIEVQLPFVLSLLSGKIQGVLQTTAADALRLPRA